MTWQEATIGGSAPSEFETIKDSINSLKDGVSAFFTILKTQIEFAKAMALDLLSPDLIAINETCDQILGLLNDIAMGPLRYIMISPWTYGVTPTYDRNTGLLLLSTPENMGYLYAALQDEGDSYRPSGSGNWGAFIFVVSCETGNISNMISLINSIGAFFNLNDLRNLASKIQLVIDRKAGTVSSPSPSIAPDFKTVTTADIFPALQEAINSGKALVEGIMEGSTKASEVFDLMLDYFDTKEAEITAIATQWTDLIDSLNLGIGGTGFYWKAIPVQANGVDEIEAAVSSGFPEEWGEHEFSVSLMIAGNDPLATFNTILGV